MLDRRILPALSIAIAGLAAVIAWRLSQTIAWVRPFELVVTIALGLAIIATVIATIRRSATWSIAIAALLLLANTGFLLADLAGVEMLAMPGPDPKVAIAVASGTLLGVGALWLRRQWAAWLCLALGAAGIGTGGLNAIQTATVVAGARDSAMQWYLDLCRYEWALVVIAIGGALIVLNVVAARHAFVAPAAWTARTGFVRALRLSMIASFVAVPMLLVYAWMQPIAIETRTTALVLAAVLTLGAILAARGKLAGALVLVVAGLGLLAQTVATYQLATSREVAAYYVVFWTPAAILAIVSGALLAQPVVRFLRAR